MMKPKISPQEYQKTLKNLELKVIYLSGLTVNLNEEIDAKQLQIEIKEKSSFQIKDKTLKNSYQYKFFAKNKEAKESFLTVSCEYTVLYSMSEDTEISKEFYEIFTNFVLNMTVWPYFRELISNVISRVNMPPLVLPMKKL